jgi:pyruvate dehydrogenase E2 component (dihydrolipoamide acetyltransferase)
MPVEFKLPDLGENVESGDVLRVLVHEGEVITANQRVLEIETGKAVVELPCPHAGRISRLHVKEGDRVPIGGLLLTLDSADAATLPPEAPRALPSAKTPVVAPFATTDPPEVPVAPAVDSPAASPRLAVAELPNDDAPASADLLAPAGPATRRFARELGVDLSRVVGSGPGGRITRDDVVEAVRRLSAGQVEAGPPPPPTRTPTPTTAPQPEVRPSASDAYGPVRRERLSRIRRTIADNMVRSSQTIPHVTNFDDADITELERIRKESAADYAGMGLKLTMMPFLLKATAHALKMHSMINASLDLDRDEIIYKEYVSVGVAVDTPRGLVVPVLRHIDRMSIPQIAQAVAQAALKVKDGQFALDDIRGGTFTVSNLGAIGGTYSTPIINPPEVAILLVGRSRMLPRIVEEKIVPRLMTPLSLSYDHRIVDGAVAARFLNDVISFLEAPGRLLLAP